MNIFWWRNKPVIDVPPVTPTDPAKPGWRSTEWWTVLLGLALTALVATGRLTPDGAEWLKEPLTQIVTLVIALVGQILLTYRYLQNRTALKQELMRLPVAEVQPSPPADAGPDVLPFSTPPRDGN